VGLRSGVINLLNPALLHKWRRGRKSEFCNPKSKINFMNWYLSKLVFRIICGDGDHNAQFDEQLRLIAAGTSEEAFLKSQQIGRQEQESFYNNRRQLVQWKFINTSELYRLHDLIDGTEVYSRIEERDDAGNYIHFVNQKANRISNREQGIKNDEWQMTSDVA
jgi:hypothetical protein